MLQSFSLFLPVPATLRIPPPPPPPPLPSVPAPALLSPPTLICFCFLFVFSQQPGYKKYNPVQSSPAPHPDNKPPVAPHHHPLHPYLLPSLPRHLQFLFLAKTTSQHKVNPTGKIMQIDLFSTSLATVRCKMVNNYFSLTEKIFERWYAQSPISQLVAAHQEKWRKK